MWLIIERAVSGMPSLWNHANKSRCDSTVVHLTKRPSSSLLPLGLPFSLLGLQVTYSGYLDQVL
jgi:hypothetical protein